MVWFFSGLGVGWGWGGIFLNALPSHLVFWFYSSFTAVDCLFSSLGALLTLPALRILEYITDYAFLQCPTQNYSVKEGAYFIIIQSMLSCCYLLLDFWGVT